MIRIATSLILNIQSSADVLLPESSSSRFGNTFPIEFPIIFKIEQDGDPAKNVSLDLDYGDGFSYRGSLIDFSGNHTYTSVGKFNIKFKVKRLCYEPEGPLTLENLFGVLNNKTIITIKESLTGLTISDNAPTVINEKNTFTLSWNTLGTNTSINVSFGDGENIILAEEKRKVESFWREKFQRIDPSKKEIILEHTYNKIGDYVVSVKGWNDVSSQTLSYPTVIVNKKCRYPKLTISGISTDPQKATTFTRDRAIVLHTRVVIDCQASYDTEFEWKVYKGKCKNSNTGVVPIDINTPMEGPSLFIPSYSLPQGSICLSFRAKMKLNVDGIESKVYGYLNVVPGKLKAAIVGGNARTASSQRPIQIDGSISGDHDLKERNFVGLTFYWFCRRLNESFPQRVDTVAPADLESARLNSVGKDCGGGVLRMLNRSASVWEISPGELRENEKYAFTLMIKKDTREATFEQIVDVEEGIPPEVVIR